MLDVPAVDHGAGDKGWVQTGRSQSKHPARRDPLAEAASRHSATTTTTNPAALNEADNGQRMADETPIDM